MKSKQKINLLEITPKIKEKLILPDDIQFHRNNSQKKNTVIIKETISK